MSGIVGSGHNIRGSGVIAKLGTDGQVFTSAGAGVSATFEDAAGGGFTQTSAIATTSGTNHTFTSIPSGTNIIYLLLNDVSINNNDDDFLITIGDSGGLETSGYNEFNGRINAGGLNTWTKQTAAWHISVKAIAYGVSGFCQIVRGDANGLIWHFSAMSTINLTGAGEDGSCAFSSFSTGVKTLSAELDRVDIKGDAGSTFDRGSMTLLYI